MEYSKVKIDHLIHKKSCSYCLIIPNGVSSTKNAHLYENEIHPTWTPIKSYLKISKLVQNLSNYNNNTIPIQLVTSCGNASTLSASSFIELGILGATSSVELQGTLGATRSIILCSSSGKGVFSTQSPTYSIQGLISNTQGPISRVPTKKK
jgi:hypothetical protein